MSVQIFKIKVMVNQDLLKRSTIDSEICHGKPCIRGMRYPVFMLLELLSSGMTSEEILLDYPSLEKEDLQACTLYASLLTNFKSMIRLEA